MNTDLKSWRGKTVLKTPQSKRWREFPVHSHCAERLDCGAFTAAVARDWSSLPREQFPVARHRQAGLAEGEGVGAEVCHAAKRLN
jgi:hypothetical protein